LKVLLFGFGLIGKERYKALIDLGICMPEDIDIVDINKGIKLDSTPQFDSELFNLENINFLEEGSIKQSYDLLLISTPHLEALDILDKYNHLSRNILIEKPMGLNINDAERIKLLEDRDKKIYVGFNYRFFPPIQELKKDIFNNSFGELINVSFTIGLGHQPGADKNWRLNLSQIPYGSLIDPGIHILDLINYLLDGLNNVNGISSKKFWKKGYYEDLTIIGETSSDVNVAARISNVMWRSTFQIQVLGTEGYGIIEGRGRSYGPQKYIKGERWGWTKSQSQRESEKIVISSNCEDSFKDEIRDICLTNSGTAARAVDGYKAMNLLDIIDKSLSQ